MKIVNLRESIKQTRIFLLKAQALERRLKDENNFGLQFYICGCKESGTVKRASMDLTRSLSELRNE